MTSFANEILSTRVINAPREKVYRAFANPQHLKNWWGPAGFTNTFYEFDLRAGGKWKFTMHGPDGANYENESDFVEIVENEQIVFNHVVNPLFQMVISFEEAEGKTKFGFRMIFESEELCNQLKPICLPSNEENFDRLEAQLALMDLA